MTRMHIKLYFPRWFWSDNLGDSMMLSSVFKAIKAVYNPSLFEVITDEVLVNTFYNDPYIDIIRQPNWRERILPEKVYKEKHTKYFLNSRNTETFVIWPDWQKKLFAYLSNENNLNECINAPYKNILSYNFAFQISGKVAQFHDLRPRIYLTDDEIREAKKIINNNSIAINVAHIRYTQNRTDRETLRYKRNSWKRLVNEIKKAFPSLRIYEIGQNQFEGIGDKFIPKSSFRKLAALLNEMNLVILSDGGIHHVCNAIDKNVLLFQGYEWNPPDLYKMHNAIFNETYHTECRKQCHLFSEISQIPSAITNCHRECYLLDPVKLAHDCIMYLNGR
jgi:ADP-heptose:LPS heptosyltransferase